MSSTIVIVDTNVIADSPGLSSSSWRSLIEQRAEWDLRFAVPDVVQMESVNVVRRLWIQQRQKVETLKVGGFGLSEVQNAMISTIEERIAGYEQELSARLEDIGASVESSQHLDLLEIARRASERRAPYFDNRTTHEKNDKTVSTKDGFRDTLIWLAVVDCALKNPGCDVWFVSKNHRDFGSRSGDKTKGDDDACPHPLHTELAGDLEAAEVADHVFYVRSLERLEQHLASQFASASEEVRTTLIDQIDLEAFSDKLEHAIGGSEISPRDAGLPLTTAVASLASFSVQPGSLRLADAAQRAGGTWTAHFTVTVTAVIDIFNTTADLTTIGKSLLVSGQLALSPAHDIDSLAVSSIAALPGDRMRQVWNRAVHGSLVTPEMQAAIDKVNGSLITPEMQAAIDKVNGSLITPGMQAAIDKVLNGPGWK